MRSKSAHSMIKWTRIASNTFQAIVFVHVKVGLTQFHTPDPHGPGEARILARQGPLNKRLSRARGGFVMVLSRLPVV